jgi:hypothetical protein
LRCFLLAFMCWVLAGCASVVPSTMARLQTLSPAEADPAGLSVAVVSPEGLRPMPGSGRLILTARRTDTGVQDAVDLILMERPGDAGAFGVADGERVTYYQLADADVPRLRALQDKLAAWQAEAPDATQESLSVGVGACAEGAGPSPDAAGSVFVRADGGWRVAAADRERTAGVADRGRCACGNQPMRGYPMM